MAIFCIEQYSLSHDMQNILPPPITQKSYARTQFFENSAKFLKTFIVNIDLFSCRDCHVPSSDTLIIIKPSRNVSIVVGRNSNIQPKSS